MGYLEKGALWSVKSHHSGYDFHFTFLSQNVSISIF